MFYTNLWRAWCLAVTKLMWGRKTYSRVSPQRKTLLTGRKNDTNREMVAASDDGEGWRLVLARGNHSPPPVRKRQTTLALRTVGPRPRIEDGLSGSRWIYNITIIFCYNISSHVWRPGNFTFSLFLLLYYFVVLICWTFSLRRMMIFVMRCGAV